MGADISIYSLIRSPQIDGPADSHAKALRIREMVDQGRMRDMQMAEFERRADERSALGRLQRMAIEDKPVYEEQHGAARPGESIPPVQTGTRPSLSMTKLRDLVYGAGMVDRGMEIDKHIGEQRERELKLADTTASIRENLSKAGEKELANAQSRYRAMVEAGAPALQTYKQLVAKGAPEAQASAEAKRVGLQNLQLLVNHGIIDRQHYDAAAAMPFDPAQAEQTLNALIGWDKAIDNERQARAQRSTEGHQRTMEDLRRREIEQSDARAREGDARAREGRVPPGYRMKPDGTMEPIAGGPADIGKALPQPAVRELSAAGTAVEDTRRLVGSFKDEFGGKTILGDTSNTMGRVFGDSTGQTQWWQDMDALQNRTRHELFGSALTKTELAAWEKTSVTPRMDAKQIRDNLQRRVEIEARAASKLSRAYETAGYNKQQIRELLGSAAEYLERAAPPASQVRPAPPASSVRPAGASQPASSAPAAQPRVERTSDSPFDARELEGRVMMIGGVRYRSDGTRWVRER